MSAEKSPRIDVAMATYNGERFLHEFLLSLEHQNWSNMTIVVGDDQSMDQTVKIIAASKIRSDIHINSHRLGPRANFSKTLSRTTAPYVALADQDDIWLPDKLNKLMDKMRETEGRHPCYTPILVFSDLRIVDSKCENIAESFFVAAGKSIEAKNIEDFAISSHVPGCAMLVNRALLDMALPIPDTAHMHDWWLCLVAAACGVVVSVNERLMLFRRHGENATGTGPTKEKPTALSKILRRVRQPFFHVKMHCRWVYQWAQNADRQLGELLRRHHSVMNQEIRSKLEVLTAGDWLARQRILSNAEVGESWYDVWLITGIMAISHVRH